MPVTRSDIPNLAIHPSFCGLISTVIFPCPSLPSSCSSKSQKIMLSVALSLIFSATLTKIIWVWHLTGALRWGSEKDLFERGEKKKGKVVDEPYKTAWQVNFSTALKTNVVSFFSCQLAWNGSCSFAVSWFLYLYTLLQLQCTFYISDM